LPPTAVEACLVGGRQGVLQTPDRDVVEVQAVGPARLQRFDLEVLTGDLGQELLEVLHLNSLRGGCSGEVMNALLPLEAKLFSRERRMKD
jgi:hypothetical protein